MDQLRTYSRKSRLADTFDSAYKSSQESFFDSPDDPYSFDSQQSSFELPQAKIAVRSQPHTSSSALESTPPSKHLQASPPQTKKAVAVPHKQHKTRQGVTGILSRLSRSSSQETATQAKRAAPDPPKNSCLEAPAAKRACVKRSSGTSVNQVRRSSGKNATERSQSSAPATTVLEAQESGEHTQILDDIVYAIDGLGQNASRKSWQESSRALAEICNTRRGRQAFRIEGVFKEAMAAALQLPLHDDCTTALAFAAMLLNFASGDVANRALLASKEAVLLMGKLLMVHTPLQSCSAAAQKLAKLFRNGAMSMLLVKHPDPSPSLIITIALGDALAPDKSSLAADKLKESLRLEGVLDQLACATLHCAAQQDQAVSSSTTDDDGDRPPSAFNQCLSVLEHASFACQANEQHLISLHVPAVQSSQLPAATSNHDKQQQQQSLPDWLVKRIQLMQSASIEAQAESDWSCIQSGLSVLINMTHNNAAGCQAVAAAGGLAMAVDIIVSCMQSQSNETADAATPRRALAQVRQHVLTDVGPITAALGLLINLVESSTDCRQQLKTLQLPEQSPADSLQKLLCKLMQASASTRANSASLSPMSGSELTEQCLVDHEDEGAASIVEVYAALLLGFLLAEDAPLQAEAVQHLGSLRPVLSAVEKCLSFYVDAGAIMSQNEESLKKLLVSLRSSVSASNVLT